MHGLFEFTWGAGKLALYIVFAFYVAVITVVGAIGFVKLSRGDKMIPMSRADKSSASEEW